MIRLVATALLLPLAACSAEPAPPADPSPDAVDPPAATGGSVLLDGAIAPAAPSIPVQVRALGTEPFWAAHVSEGQVRYSTPENVDGETFAAERSDGQETATVTGMLGELPFTLRVTTGECSDGMSDRVYPFSARLTLGTEERRGCARPIEG